MTYKPWCRLGAVYAHVTIIKLIIIIIIIIIICPIHKTGPKDDPNNYQGITLLNVIGKLITAILLTQWAIANQLLPEIEFGFRKNRRATDCVFIVNTLIDFTTELSVTSPFDSFTLDIAFEYIGCRIVNIC